MDYIISSTKYPLKWKIYRKQVPTQIASRHRQTSNLTGSKVEARASHTHTRIVVVLLLTKYHGPLVIKPVSLVLFDDDDDQSQQSSQSQQQQSAAMLWTREESRC
jgi:hypothetical protein